MAKEGILLIQLGSPKTYNVEDVKTYLKAFLSDSRVVDAKRPWLWRFILNFFILPRRAISSARAYKSIWRKDGLSPLAYYTESFAKKLQKKKKEKWVKEGYSYEIKSIKEK